MTSATLVTLKFEEPVDQSVETGNSCAAVESLIDLIRKDVNCRFLYKGSALDDHETLLLLIGWTTDPCTPSLESLIPHLASPASVRHLNFPNTLDILTTSVSPISCDVHTLRVPSFPSAGFPPSFDTGDLHTRIESLNLNPYISGNPENKRSMVAHMPSRAGMQTFQGCYRAWSRSAHATDEQDVANRASKGEDAGDDEHVLIVQWLDRQSGEDFKNPGVEKENLNPQIWQTHFTSELNELEEHGVTRTEFRVDWHPVSVLESHQSQSQSQAQALLQLSRSQSLSRSHSHSRSHSRSRSQSQSSNPSHVSRTPSLSQRSRSRSQSLNRDRARSIGDRSESTSLSSFDTRERSQSLGERRGSIGEVRDEEVGVALEQRQSLSLRELSRFQFEADSSDSDSDYEDGEDGAGDEDGDALLEARVLPSERKDSGTVLSGVNVSGALGEIREEEEDETGELRESGVDLARPAKVRHGPLAQVASACAKLEENSGAQEREDQGPVPMRGKLIDEARAKLDGGSGQSRRASQREKRYSGLLEKDVEETREISKGPGLARTKTLPAQARDSLKLELSKSRMERMSSVHG